MSDLWCCPSTDGSPPKRVRGGGLKERWHKVDTSGDCWVWTGMRDDDGYGRIKILDKKYLTHRLAYQEFVGPIPDGMFVCHTCDNPPCVNPEHLWVGTVLDNTRDMMRKGRQWQIKKTHCPKGHEYTDENTFIARGRRHCRECGRQRQLRYNRKKRAEVRAAKALEPPRPKPIKVCKRGHLRTPENVRPSGNCIACEQMQREQKKAA